MLSQITNFINPNTKDPEEIRKRELIRILSIGLFACALVAMIVIVTFLTLNPEKWQKADNQLLVVIGVVSLIGSLVIYQVNKYSSRISSSLLLLFLTIASAFSDTPEQLVNGRSLFVFMLSIAIASQILTPFSSFVFAFINSLIITFFALSIDTIPNISAIAIFFFLALISWLSARSLEQALKDLRLINLNLDKLVEQKTQDLAETLSREIVLAGRNQAILDSIADGVIVFDENHVSILANPALSNLTEIPIENLKGIQASTFIKNESLSAANQGIIMAAIEDPKKIEEGIRLEWGRRTLSLSVARVQDVSKRANLGSVAVFRDITKEAELDKMKQTFVAIVSHELRTPANAIMGYSEMIKEAFYGPVNEKQIAASERIMVNTNRMLSMVGDLLDEAQLKAGKLSIKNETFKTDSLLVNMHSTMDKITSDKGISLTDELDPNMPETITGDPQRLNQIIVNLVNNAAKFTETGGIHVRITRSDIEHWKIEVIDTGAGIPEKDIPYIFDTFRQVEETTTRKHGGFGLGLAIVKQLIELMKGKIVVKSELNKGSTFTVTLPLQ